MNKVEKSKILNYCIQNAENLFFSHIKEIDLIKKNKKIRYMDNNEVSDLIITFYFEETLFDLERQKKIINDIISTTAKIKMLLEYQLNYDLKRKYFLKKVFMHLSKEKKFSQILDYCFKISSKMWDLAGDASTDLNYYSKRLILSAVYSKTFIKIITLSDYKKEKIIGDIDSSLKKVKTFNEIKSKICSVDILSLLNKFKPDHSKGRGF
jgi:ubiquinone biosynthesis protein COQ9